VKHDRTTDQRNINHHSGHVWRLALVVLGLIAYANSFAGVFLLDDFGHIVTSESIRSVGPLSKHLADFRPLVHFSLAANYSISGLEPWSYHVFNLVVHLAVGLTLFALVRRTLRLDPLAKQFTARADVLAFFVALLWLVHPIQTQAVTYVVQRGESLMSLFYLLVLYGLLRGATSSRPMPWYVLCVMCCAAGMFSKESMATVPAAALLYDTVFLARSWREAISRRGALYLLLAATWGILLYLGLFHDILYGSKKHGADLGFQVEGVTPWRYALTQPGLLLHYLRLCFWPHPLCFDYGWPLVSGWREAALPGMAMGGLLIATLWCLWKRPGIGFLSAWVFLILSPTSSFIPIKDFAFEHRMYLPLAAIVCGVVLAADAMVRRRPRWKAPIVTLGAVVVFALTGRTLARNADYSSAVRMWADVVRQRPMHVRGWNSYGVALGAAGRHAEAEQAFRAALRLNPRSEEANVNLGKTLSKMDRYAEAIPYFEEGLRQCPDDALYHHSLAIALDKTGRLEEALAEYRRTLELNPAHPYARFNMAIALRDAKRYAEARVVLEDAVRVNPSDAQSRKLLELLPKP
jgi:Flp pilus assembly protein TadD